jgi:hypothetical protein
MTRSRIAFIHLLISVILFGSLYDIATQQEHWPFSDYPMFSNVHRESVLEWPRLYGVRTDGSELALLDHQYLAPLDQSRLPLGLRRIYREEGSGPRLQDAIADCLRRYERRRVAGKHDGPPLRALRLYLVSWNLEPYAANLDRPNSRQLIGQVTLALPTAYAAAEAR